MSTPTRTSPDIVERLRYDAIDHKITASDCDCRPEDTANWQHATNCLEAADEIERLRGAAQEQQQPVAWIVKWRTKHTPENASAYLNEADAQRAAANVKMYAYASDVVIITAFAAAQDPVTPSPDRERTQQLADKYGLALMMIREGCADPVNFAASTLSSTTRGGDNG